jgi:glutaconyl-CoA/methylmalonyl-CoA decarboxylase subunit gamma
MRFVAKVDGADVQVVAGADGAVAVGADRFEAKVAKPAPDRRTVEIGGKGYEVRVIEASAESGKYMLELSGERIPIVVTDVMKGGATAARGRDPGAAAAAAAKRTAKPAEGDSEGVRAPMPGKIVDVFVEPGDRVDAGDVVLILEAMKMENELRAPKKATVKSVLVKKADPVAGGQLLVALE